MAFKTTRWSIVLNSRSADEADRRRALEELCATYWSSLYALLRKRGHSPEQAEDLVQGFFAKFLDTDGFAKADPDRGRLRSFLAKSLENYSRNEWAKESAQKRPNPRDAISVDIPSAERDLRVNVQDIDDPRSAYERQWALSVLKLAFNDVRAQYESAGKGERFEHLAAFITGDGQDADYRAVSDRLGMNPGAIRVSVHRLRVAYQKAIRQRVRDTVESDEQVEEEIEYLMSCF